jgi:Zn-dependent metalloprotease
MTKQILLVFVVAFMYGQINAQQTLSVAANSISITKSDNTNSYYANRNEPARAIEFEEPVITATNFIANINSYFNIPSEFAFVEEESNTDNIGMRHHLLKQYYKGMPLEGLGYRVHERNGFVTSANGRAVSTIRNLEIQSVISEEQAFRMAVHYLKTKDTVFRPSQKLIVSKDFTFAPESFSIAYQFDIDVSLIERWRISMDARSGDPINKVSLVNSCYNEKEKEREATPPLPYGTGTGLTNYYGTQNIRVEMFENSSSRLVGQTENGGIVGTYNFRNASIMAFIFDDYDVYDFYSSDNTYINSTYKPAISVQWAAEQAFEYYFKKHKRNSFDNNGSPIQSYVHVDVGMNNAFWSQGKMLFGDGSNNNPLVELDIVGHELTHGVTQHEANLYYLFESGALNESFSDILGKAIEFDTFGDTATWQLAKHYRTGGLRDFSNPNLKNQPDTYKGDLWFTGYEDFGGVHYNSGVQNFWFYLLCEGGSGINDNQISYSINAIGMDTASNIAYRNLTEYLSYFSEYLDSRIGSLLATADLYGKNSNAYREVDNAWDAVGVIDEPGISNFELYDITATTVKIKGSLIPRSDTATYHFEYGTTPAFGSSSSIYQYIDKVEGKLTGLQSETKYYLRLAATNENGSTYSTVTEFTTISLSPLVKIIQTVDVTETTAVLYGLINPNSLPTSFYFEYGLTTSFGFITPLFPLPDTTEFLKVSYSITNLQPRQTYYYRLVATNGHASAFTERASFFTAVKPKIISFAPVTAAVGTEVTITGLNFNPSSERNLVSFGATRANVLSSSSNEIKVVVPSGASFGQISLLDSESGLTAVSVQEFVPTFIGEFNQGSIKLKMGSTDFIYQTIVQDMDGDSKPDIVALHYLGFTVFLNVNQGGDITDESFVKYTFNSEATPGTLSLIDFDGNGLEDVVGRYQNGLRIYPNYSVPGFVSFGLPVDVSIGFFQEVTYNDFDQDGHIDIASISNINGDTAMLTIFRNQNPKGFVSASNFELRYTKLVPYYSFYMNSGDLNNDDLPDLMIGSHFGNFLAILKNISQPNSFEFEENIVLDSSRGRFVRYSSSDLNQDGWKDIISHSPWVRGNVAITENKSTSPTITLGNPIVVLGGYLEQDTQPGDINGDGKVDLLVGLSNRTFFLLENKTEANKTLSDSSFVKNGEYGMPLVNVGSGIVDPQLTINDLNGDGRPEIISTYGYYFWPHDGYQMEIWENSTDDCIDPSLIRVEISNSTAAIVLPPNTTVDQFQIEYKLSGSAYWNQSYSTTLYLISGYSYELRVRALCYLYFTDYYYTTFTSDCVNTSNFFITSIGNNSITIYSDYLNSLEIQYSPTGKNQWITLPQSVQQISNLQLGTTYDIGIRGRCNTPTQFNYRQFTTLCPNLSTLTVSEVSFNRAIVNWTSSFIGQAILEYSANNVDWILIDETRTMFPLVPGKHYFVRGRFDCTDINSDFTYTSFTKLCPILTQLNVVSVTPFSATMNWLDESNTGNYILTYLTEGGAVTTAETTSTSFNLIGLSPGTQYTLWVAPHCIGSKIFTSTIFSTVCYAPFDLIAENITHTTAKLSWSDNFSGMPYSVDYSIAGSNIWQTTETTSTHISLTELRPGTQYEARVHINCTSETAPYVSVQFETDLYDETTFAPNPTEGEITIFPSKNLIGSRFSIHDNAGRKLAGGNLLDYRIDLSGLAPGIYMLKIEGEKPMKIIRR